ncbi:ABC transporter ATP-binding protein [bacterium]|nr:ABC transporter ATP-binding protein [bacterium]
MILPKLRVLTRTLKFVYDGRKWSVLSRELLLIVGVFIDLYSITLWGKFIDTTGEFFLTGTKFILKDYFISDSFFYLALATGCWLLSFSIIRLRNFLAEDIHQHLNFAARTVFFEKIAKSNLEDIESKDFRDLMTFTDYFGPANLWSTYSTFTLIVKNLVTGISALAILSSNVGLWSLAIVVMVLPETVFGYLGRKKIKHYHDKKVERMKWTNYVENLMTRINTFQEMKVDGTFTSIKKEYGEKTFSSMSDVLDLNKHLYIDTTFFSVIGKVLFTIFTILMLAVAMAKSFTIGSFKAMYDYSLTIYMSFYDVFDMSFNIFNFLEYNDKFFKFNDFQGFGDAVHGEKTLGTNVPSLEFKGMDFEYPDGTDKVLENLNMRIEPGEKVMIIGDDGSGKSTLIKILCGLYRVIVGDFEVGGYSIRELGRGQLKHKVSVVFQDFVNYNTSLKKNITMSSEGSRINHAVYEQVLKISGVDKLMKHFDISENQILGKYTARGKDVSPGFWQRLAIARMLYRNRQIFILDEPFTYIDDGEEDRILKELMDFVGDKTVIYITRDSRHKKYFDKIYHLKKGKLFKI